MRVWRFSRLGGSTFASTYNAAASDAWAMIPVIPAIAQAQDELAERGLFEEQKVSGEQVATLQQQKPQEKAPTYETQEPTQTQTASPQKGSARGVTAHSEAKLEGN